MDLVLKVHYRTPSLNVTKRQHWAQQFKEKRLAFLALDSALQDTGFGLSTPITSQEVSRICLMASDTLNLYMGTSGGESRSKPSKSKSLTTKKSTP